MRSFCPDHKLEGRRVLCARISRMYKENRKSINAWVGCLHHCIYCVPSFQRQMKRVAGRIGCSLCANYEPHYHPERLRRPPKTKKNEFIFFPSSGDLAFAPRVVVEDHIKYVEAYPDTTFLIQSKNPLVFLHYDWPKNVILGTTIETDKPSFETPSRYRHYYEISEAPLPIYRYQMMLKVKHAPKLVTIEPILDFSMNLVSWILDLSPSIVYIGYDNHNCHLPEPKRDDTLILISALEKITEVRRKTIRKAWYEE